MNIKNTSSRELQEWVGRFIEHASGPTGLSWRDYEVWGAIEQELKQRARVTKKEPLLRESQSGSFIFDIGLV